MQFITKDNAPDIPLSIITSQQDERLVLFCGAGISVPEGLPLFEELVNEISKELEPKKCQSDNVENPGLDSRLSKLEKDFHRNRVRELLIKKLELKPDAKLETHKAILELSRLSKDGYRLVTTNVDHGFKNLLPLECPEKSNDFPNLVIHTAPALPVPTKHGWNSVVHIHGIIDKKLDPNGEHLVFTSGDFGSAYLTDGWASKFLSELFRNFTVLFVGYSLDDPVLKYITDAISAEKNKGLLGESRFFEPSVLVGIEDEKEENTKKRWENSGINPIYYDSSENHNLLHETLIAWAKYVKGGRTAKYNVIQKAADMHPSLDTYEKDREIKGIIEILKEGDINSNKDITGDYAEFFKNLNPTPPIEWLSILEKQGLLSLSVQNYPVYPVGISYNSFIMPSNKISSHLWGWIANHLEEDKLIEWVIKNGCIVHPKLKELIPCNLRNIKKEEYRDFWKIILSENLAETKDDYSISFQLNPEEKINTSQLNHLVTYLEPKIIFKGWSPDNIKEKSGISKLKADIIIGLENWQYKEIKKNKSIFHGNSIEKLLISATSALYKALFLLEMIKKGSSSYCGSQYKIASIIPHKQNTHDNGYPADKCWVILVIICRDFWKKAYDLKLPVASNILEYWKSLNYPVFRRLVLHAYTHQSAEKPKEALNYLLQENSKWLWNKEVIRENFRLIDALSSNLSDKGKNKLLKAILSGSPKESGNKRQREATESAVVQFLRAMKYFGYDLSARASNRLKKFIAKNPNWRQEHKEEDEFSSYLHSGTGYSSTDITEKNSSEVPDKIVEFLKIEDILPKEAKLLTTFENLGKNKPEKILEVLTYMDKEKEEDTKIWGYGLCGLAQSNYSEKYKALSLLKNRPSSLFSNEAWNIARFIEAVSKDESFFKVKENLKESGDFWDALDRFFENIKEIKTFNYKEEESSDNIITYPGTAINKRDIGHKSNNEPVGIITRSIIHILAMEDPKKDSTIPEPFLRYLNKIINCRDESLNLGKAILASELNYFYNIDPEWTKNNLLPKFSWYNPTEAAAIWQGYLWNPSGSLEILALIKDSLLKTFDHTNNFEDLSKKKLYRFFTIICLEHPRFYQKDEKQTIINSFSKESLIIVALTLWQNVEKKQNNEKLHEKMWKYSLKEFVQDIWPKNKDKKDPKISWYLALMIIALGSDFPEALKILEHILDPFSDVDFHDIWNFLQRLNEKNIAGIYPNEIWNLLKILLPEGYKTFNQYDAFSKQWGNEELKKVINQLETNKPEIRNEKIFNSFKC